MDAGHAIKRARLRAGLTQHALAARAGTSQATVSAYEGGRKTPSVATLDRLLAATGARLAIAPRSTALEPSAKEMARRGKALLAVLGLAEALPVRHQRALRYPRLG